MDKSLFRYIWTHSKRDQLIILAVIAASLPFYFWSLDLPKRIVNDAIQGRAFVNGAQTVRGLGFTLDWPGWLGGGRTVFFEGFDLERTAYLFALSGVFLTLVLINGAFKYYINIQKGVIGERMLRRLRFDLFAILLRFPPEEMRSIKAAEAAGMIKDEVEPIGGFIGDAFIQPAFLGTQALTALAFILTQNIWLGLIAGGIVAVQAVLIPYLRREQLRLGKERQIASRKLAGRIGEIVEGVGAVHNHGAGPYESAEIGGRLGILFHIRFKLYKRKFAVKYINNLLAQLTPFFFYTVGGWFAINGQLDIGQLVAVIAAYRDLPPPVKELIDWDQQRADVGIKYEQVIEQFSPMRPLPLGGEAWRDPPRELSLVGLTVADPRGAPLLEHAAATIALPAHLALIGPPGSGRDALARVLGRQITQFSGKVCFDARDIASMSDDQASGLLAYVGHDPRLFPGSIRDNLVYGLRRRIPTRHETGADLAAHARMQESLRSGNPPHDADDSWIDCTIAGVDSASELDARIIDILKLLNFDADVYRFGLSGRIDAIAQPELAMTFASARKIIADALAAQGKVALVESFDPALYNHNASVGENLLFGVPVGDMFTEANLAHNSFMRAILDAEELSGPLADIGLSIASTTLEMFAGLPPGHPLFERYSFIAASDLGTFEDLLERWRMRRRAETLAEDRDRLMGLAFAYVEPRHRLGLLSADVQDRIVKARVTFREMISAELAHHVEFYDPQAYCNAAPIRDNLLFGRVAYGIAGATEKVASVIEKSLETLGLQQSVYRIGLDYQIGTGGKLLFAAQRTSVDLAASLLRRPHILILDDALRAFSAVQSRRLLDNIAGAMAGRTLIVCVSDEADAAGFPVQLVFGDTRLSKVTDIRADVATQTNDVSTDDVSKDGLAQENSAHADLAQADLARAEQVDTLTTTAENGPKI